MKEIITKLKEDNTARIEFIDVAKGIGIICVMFGHLGCSMIDRVVFTFHMPLFFLISGYFLKIKTPFNVFVNHGAKRLLIPYYATGGAICFLLFWADVVRGMKENILPDFLDTLISILYGSCFAVSDYVKGIGAIWFLWALFWATIIVKIFIQYKNSAIYVLLLAVIAYVSSQYFWLPLSIQPGACAAVFVYIGAKLQQIDLKYFNNIWLIFVSVIAFCIEIIMGIRVDMAKNSYDLGLVSVIGAIFICYLILYISNVMVLFLPQMKNIVIFWGKYSLYLLCIHQIEMRVFPWSIVENVLKNVGLSTYFNCVVILVRVVGCSFCTLILIEVLRRCQKVKKSFSYTVSK